MGHSETQLIDPPSLVSIVVPAFNEQDNIAYCVEQLYEATGKAGYEVEIIVVNDGSTDDTLHVSRSLKKGYTFLRILDLGRNYGKATALAEGIRAARGDIIAFFDADMQYDASDLVRLVGLVNNGTDVANGRRDYGSYELPRTAFSRIYNKALRLLFRVRVSDSNCGLKALRKRAGDPDTLFRYGLPLMVPLLRVRGFSMGEIEVSLRQRRAGQSKYFRTGSFLGGWRNFRDISYHSGMLLGFMANLPSELLKHRDRPA